MFAHRSHRKGRILAAIAITLGSLVPLNLATAQDQPRQSTGAAWTTPSPDLTPVHLLPAADSLVIKFKHPGNRVTGTCQYYNNRSEHHWYMQVFVTTGPNQPYYSGYIWVQRLSYGSTHTCNDDGHTHSVGSGNCPLIWRSPPSDRCRGLTAPESVGRRCAQLRESGADLALGPRLVHGALAFWMQTTGAVLVAIKRLSLVRMWMLAQGSRSAHRLLYVAAVRDDRLPGPLLHDGQIGANSGWPWPGLACPWNLTSRSGRPARQPDRWLCMSYLEERECLCCNEWADCSLPKLAVRLANSPPN